MVNLFAYTDYRKYLCDYYNAKKASNPDYSYQCLAQKAGINNRGFAYNIINGKKALSKSNCFKISKALGHSKTEAEYFENLISFNNSETPEMRLRFFERINSIKSRDPALAKAQIVRKDQYEFYATWYHSAVRSIIDMHKFKDDYKWLAKMVVPAITVKQARQSIRLLEKLEIIKRQKDGYFNITDKRISTGRDILGLAIHNFHAECADLAQRAIRTMPKNERDFTGLTLGISNNTYKKICEEIREFQNKIMDIADVDEAADKTYQFNFQLFPISKEDGERKKNHENQK
ncbi:MAG: TIGR02147 family protein [Chitinivibrionales bacterium]|nr:TIGR02147 family protein [Chitinivibrionales bacterium]